MSLPPPRDVGGHNLSDTHFILISSRIRDQPMSFLEYLTGEKFRLITDLIISCGGFLMALYINTALDRRRERREFKSLFTCVAGEAISNRLILHEGFLAFLDEGIITRPLTTICVESAISSALFARYACAADYTISCLLYTSDAAD